MDEAALSALLSSMGLAMDIADLKALQDYFRETERRDPTVTELRVVDTYWSDHCRHTTFSTHLDEIRIDDDAVKVKRNSQFVFAVGFLLREFDRKDKTGRQSLMNGANDVFFIGA